MVSTSSAFNPWPDRRLDHHHDARPERFGQARPGGNHGGQVAYRADLADGRSGVFLFTPELRWRAGAGGNCDTAANWTVGLAPEPMDSEQAHKVA